MARPVPIIKLFCGAVVAAIIAMPIVGPGGLLGVMLAIGYLCKNAHWLLPADDAGRNRDRPDTAAKRPNRQRQ